jgi:hypothetical protein
MNCGFFCKMNSLVRVGVGRGSHFEKVRIWKERRGQHHTSHPATSIMIVTDVNQSFDIRRGTGIK